MPSLEDLISDVTDLVPLPQAYIRIRELVFDPDSSLHAVTQIISNDAGLTGRILRIANSAYMGLVTKVDSISRAVQVLGLHQVHDLALATSAVEALSKMDSEVIDLQDYWRRSIYCAVVARLLGKRCELAKHERLFVSGLLHDIGHLVLARKAPTLYTELLSTAIRRHVPLYEVERETLGFDYAAITTGLLEKWQLPAEIVTPIRWHCYDVANAGEDRLADTSIVHVAAAISRGTQWYSDDDEPVPTFDPEAAAATDIDDERVTEIMDEADVAIIEAITLLMPKNLKQSPRPPWNSATVA